MTLEVRCINMIKVSKTPYFEGSMVMRRKTEVEKMRKWLWRNKEIWISSLLGAVVFVLIYGVHILNPCYTDWLFHGVDGDLTQHYLGWKFYRHAGWNFPVGLIDTMAYPYETSVIFTDSIPLFAFVFKLFRFMLPVQFQYFGWFGLMCFILQGAVGAKLVKRYVSSSYGVVVGGLIFVLSPVFIDRMYWMTSLAGHFLCLLALMFVVYYEPVYNVTKKAVIGWGVLGVLCSGIHIYFLPMCGIILLGFVLLDLVKGKKKWKALLPPAAYIGAAAVTVFLFGGFGSGMKAGNDGLGYYSFNLNGFYNPHGWSAYLKDMFYTDSQYEGFGYLGLGVLVLLLFASLVWLGSNFRIPKLSAGGTAAENSGKTERKGKVGSWAVRHIDGMAWALIIAVTLFASASNVVMYGEKVLYEMPLPQFIVRLWSVFRATGRLIWPVVYVIVLGAICMDGKIIGSRVKNLLLTACLLLQILDIKGTLAAKNQMYHTENVYQTLLPSETWDRIGSETEIQHICFVSDVVNSRDILFAFGDYASDYGLTLSNFYFARSMGEKEVQAREQALAECPADTIFIFFKNESQKCLAYPMNYYEIDGLIVGCSQPLPDMEPLSKEELGTYHYDMTGSSFLSNAEVTAEGWTIHSYGNSYGPYLHAQPGTYRVTITGSGLTATDNKCYYNHGDSPLDPQNLTAEDNAVTYEVTLPEYTEDLEFAVWNVGGADIYITDMTIQKIK